MVSEAAPVYAVGYDWRKDIRLAAAELERTARQMRNAPAEGRSAEGRTAGAQTSGEQSAGVLGGLGALLRSILSGDGRALHLLRGPPDLTGLTLGATRRATRPVPVPTSSTCSPTR